MNLPRPIRILGIIAATILTLPFSLIVWAVIGMMYAIQRGTTKQPLKQAGQQVEEEEKIETEKQRQAEERAAAEKKERDRPVAKLRYNILKDSGYLTYSKHSFKHLEEWLSPDDKSLTEPGDEKAHSYARGTRWQFADAEELAEGNFESIIKKFWYLEAINLTLPEITQNVVVANDGSSTLTVGTKTYTAYAAAEMKNGLFWATSSHCLITILNDLLVAGGHDERTYILYPGQNESICIILTPAEKDLLVSWGKEAPMGEEELRSELSFDPRA